MSDRLTLTLLCKWEGGNCSALLCFLCRERSYFSFVSPSTQLALRKRQGSNTCFSYVKMEVTPWITVWVQQAI